MNFLLTSPEGFVGIAANITAMMIFLSIILATVRLIRGPSLSDRVVALDLISILLVAFWWSLPLPTLSSLFRCRLSPRPGGLSRDRGLCSVDKPEGDIEDDA